MNRPSAADAGSPARNGPGPPRGAPPSPSPIARRLRHSRDGDSGRALRRLRPRATCQEQTCVDDCRSDRAVPCAAPSLCDFLSGALRGARSALRPHRHGRGLRHREFPPRCGPDRAARAPNACPTAAAAASSATPRTSAGAPTARSSAAAACRGSRWSHRRRPGRQQAASGARHREGRGPVWPPRPSSCARTSSSSSALTTTAASGAFR